jgi:hypothetical protein
MTHEADDELRAALADRYTIERELGAGGMATGSIERATRELKTSVPGRR